MADTFLFAVLLTYPDNEINVADYTGYSNGNGCFCFNCKHKNVLFNGISLYY